MGGAGGGSMANMSAVNSGVATNTGAARGGYDQNGDPMGGFQ